MSNVGSSEVFIIGGLLIAALFGLSIFVFVLFFIRREQQSQKKCPHCAETIRPDATVCRFCGRSL